MTEPTMVNPGRSQALVDTARDVARALASLADVRAVLLFGSPAVLAADEESDLDIMCYCRQIPDPVHRLETFRRLGSGTDLADLVDHYRTNNCDSFELPDLDESGVVFYENLEEIRANLIAERRHILLESLRVGNLDIINGRRMETGAIAASPSRPLAYASSEDHLADIQNGIALHDPDGLLEKWKATIADYPEDARREVVWRRLFFAGIACGDISRAVDRGDLLHAFACKASFLEHYARALFALNRRYYRKPKALEYHLRGFEYRPEGCHARLCEFVSEAHVEKAKAMAASLLSDTESIADDLVGAFDPENLIPEE